MHLKLFSETTGEAFASRVQLFLKIRNIVFVLWVWRDVYLYTNDNYVNDEWNTQQYCHTSNFSPRYLYTITCYDVAYNHTFMLRVKYKVHFVPSCKTKNGYQNKAKFWLILSLMGAELTYNICCCVGDTRLDVRLTRICSYKAMKYTKRTAQKYHFITNIRDAIM